MQHNKTTYDLAWEQGLTEGRQEGRQEGQVRTLEKLLAHKFGPLTAEQLAAVRTLSADELDALAGRILAATSLTELGL